jgi:hypothetical protein
MLKAFSFVGALALAGSAHAATTVFDLGGATAETTGFSYTVGGKQLQVTAASYAVAPASLNQLSQLTLNRTVRREAGGLGVNTGEAAGQREQVDNDGTNEVLRLGVAGQKTRLVSAKFNFVDDNDTLRVYGVTGTTLTLLGLAGTTGFTGEFVDNTAQDSPLGNGATVTGRTPGQLQNTTVFDVAFAPSLGRYDAFLFTTRNDAADGYRLQQLAVAVPEPHVWGLMLGGFGLVGNAVRRRNKTVVTYA